jgi:hypothetical protein
MRRLTALACALALSLVAAVPAVAAGPVVIQPEWEWIDCGFDVVYGSNGHEIYKEWYDKSGDALRGINRRKGVDYFYADGHPGNKVSGKFSLVVHVSNLHMIEPELYEWDEKLTGNYWGSQLPGRGNVYHEAGQVVQHVVDWEPVEYYKFAGRFGFDEDALCAALDPS